MRGGSQGEEGGEGAHGVRGGLMGYEGATAHGGGERAHGVLVAFSSIPHPSLGRVLETESFVHTPPVVCSCSRSLIHNFSPWC